MSSNYLNGKTVKLPRLFLAAKAQRIESVAQRIESGAILVTPNSSLLLCPGQQCRGSHTGPVQIWQSLLAWLCAILLRINSLVGNINVSFSQNYLECILVLYMGEVPYILPAQQSWPFFTFSMAPSEASCLPFQLQP